MRFRTAADPKRRAGITLTEILIGILILGIGLVSLATLFPIGLLRLREAQRQTRSAYLFESATADVAARGLLNANSFTYADLFNPANAMWYPAGNPLGGNPAGSDRYNPLIQDTPYYGGDAYDTAHGGANPGASVPTSGGYGLPFAYDPLWRSQTINTLTSPPTQGTYLDPLNSLGVNLPEFRFASGNPTSTTSFLRADPSDTKQASADGLQRLTNFNPLMSSASAVAAIVNSTFVSPEDVVWQDPSNQNYLVAFVGGLVGTPSPVVPDLAISANVPTNDWRFSWMVTAQQTNGSNGASFEGNIVIFENRPFAFDSSTGAVAGETVVEAVYGPSNNVVASTASASYGYGVGADRTVLLRWPGVQIKGITNSPQPDPVVKVGDWIADVTYERGQSLVLSRFYFSTSPLVGYDNPLNKSEWDNLPAQRCFWYQVQKVTPAQLDPQLGAKGYRSMTVYVNRPLEAKTLLNVSNGSPAVLNAALISPYVVNVIPQTFFVR